MDYKTLSSMATPSCDKRDFFVMLHRPACQPLFGLLDGAPGIPDGAARIGYRTVRVGVGEEHAVHRLPCDRLQLRVHARRRDEHGMTASVNVNFNRVDVKT